MATVTADSMNAKGVKPALTPADYTPGVSAGLEGHLEGIDDKLDFDSIDVSLIPTTTNSIDLGSALKRWDNVYSADVILLNDWRITEVLDDEGKLVPGHEPEAGVIFVNSNKEEIFKITNDGLWFKGRKIA